MGRPQGLHQRHAQDGGEDDGNEAVDHRGRHLGHHQGPPLHPAGLGSFFYDCTNPVYVMEAPITLLTKGMYGLVAGLVLYYLFKNRREKYGPQVAAAFCAAVGYMLAYCVKNYFYNASIQGLTEPVHTRRKLPTNTIAVIMAAVHSFKSAAWVLEAFMAVLSFTGPPS